MKFEIDDKQSKLFNAWDEEHAPICLIKYAGAIGGVLTWKFTPTTIGLVTKVKCACGVECDLSDYNDW